MQQRPSSRLLIVCGEQHVLLFRFEHKNGPLPGQVFWATPGGGVDEGESYEDAARRELYEEVGIEVGHVGAQIAQRTATFALPNGEITEADERYFVIRVRDRTISNANWSDHEHEVMVAHRWWSQAELQSATEQVWPESIAEMLIGAGIWTAA